jgi:hypothetical protein
MSTQTTDIFIHATFSDLAKEESDCIVTSVQQTEGVVLFFSLMPHLYPSTSQPFTYFPIISMLKFTKQLMFHDLPFNSK